MIRIAFLLALMGAADLACAVPIEYPYRATTIVTGTGDAERARGLREALAEVAVKLSGDARLGKSRALEPLLGRAADFVDSVAYEDRMKGIPIHDEQGTRERSFELRVKFKPEATGQALQDAGIPLWPLDRPLVAVWFAVRTPAGAYVLQPEGAAGYGQRAVFQEAARRRGVPIALAPQKLGAPSVGPADIARFDASRIGEATQAADGILIGNLDLTESGLWNVRWLLEREGHAAQWGEENVTFDVGITEGLERAARVLAGRS